MSERILPVNVIEQTKADMTGYSIYVARRRALPDPRDGLKPVHRKILYALWMGGGKNKRTVKTAAVVGDVLKKYHPHGDASVNAAIKPMTNWFEIYKPLVDHQGSFGNMSGDGPAAPRYTEVKLSDYGMNAVIGDLNFSKTATDWQDTYDGTDIEPIYMPSVVPNLLINGSFGIAVGLRTSIPKHNISEVLDMTIKLIKNPNTNVVLIPDDCCGCDIIDADWKKISHTGKGKFKIRANTEITEFNNHPAIRITALPPMVYLSSIKTKVEKLVDSNALPQVLEIYDKNEIDETNVGIDIFNAFIVLKKGCDPQYVRDFLYANTDMEKTISVNLEVIFNESPVNLNYKDYLNTFINFRRERKLRTYTNLLMQCKTKAHKLALYIKLMELPIPKFNGIMHKIHMQKTTEDEAFINYLVKELNVTPLQAKFVLDIDVRKLSLGYLAKYKEEYNEAIKSANDYYRIVTHPEDIDSIIIDELKEMNKEFGCPRRSKVISQSEAAGIPEGIFKVVVTANGFIKKVDVNDKLGAIRDDKIDFVLTVDNKDDLVIFGKLGKAYKLPVSKVPFGKGSNAGMDIRMVVKKYTGEGICTIIPDSLLHSIEEDFKHTKQEGFIYVLTSSGLFKAMKISEMYNVPLSGLIYAKLNDGDIISDIVCMDPFNQLLLYSHNKILRISGIEAPLLSRTAKGVIAMNSRYPMDGFTCLYPKATDVVVVTSSGKINKIPLNVIPISTRAKAGSSCIKLGKTDSIYKICVCGKNDILHYTTNRSKSAIPIKDIPDGSSVSSGTKLIDSSGILNIIIEHN